MNDLINQMNENSKMLINEKKGKKFLSKIFLLFCVYLLSNYILDKIDRDNLKPTFHDKPFITIKLSNNATFKFIIILIMIIVSTYVYNNILKPLFYPE